MVTILKITRNEIDGLIEGLNRLKWSDVDMVTFTGENSESETIEFELLKKDSDN